MAEIRKQLEQTLKQLGYIQIGKLGVRYKMDSLVSRWKTGLNSLSQQQRQQNSPKKQAETEHILKKSRDEKSKMSLHSNEKVPKSKRLTTPSKKKSKNNKSIHIQKASEEILQILHPILTTNIDKNIQGRILSVLQSLWNQAKQETLLKQSTKIENAMEMQASLQESHATNITATAKKHEKLYQDLQKKYFQAEKQKHFLKNKIDTLVSKYENIDRELQRYAKIEKLIDKTIEREEEQKKQVNRLRKQLQKSEMKNMQQQRIFQKEVMNIYGLMDSIKANLQQI